MKFKIKLGRYLKKHLGLTDNWGGHYLAWDKEETTYEKIAENILNFLEKYRY